MSEKEEAMASSELYEKPKRGRRKSDKPAKIVYDEKKLSLTSEEATCLVTCGACGAEMPFKK